MELPLSRLLGEDGGSVRGLVLDWRNEADLAVEPTRSAIDTLPRFSLMSIPITERHNDPPTHREGMWSTH
jgi:hypothetical protein